MTLAFRSIVGRRLGLTSTGGIGGYVGSTGENSTAVTQLAQMWGPSLHVDVTSTVASTLSNFGITTMTSGSATAITGFEIAEPVQGVYKEIHIATSASEITFGGTSTAILFGPAAGTGDGSTAFCAAANLAGTVLTLRGMSTAVWHIHNNANVTVG